MTPLTPLTPLLTFEITGRPRPKQRPRTYRGKAGQVVTTSTPQETLTWENWVQFCCREWMKSYEAEVRNRLGPSRMRSFPIDGPVALTIEVFLPRPKKPAFDYPAGPPDLDNLVKSITDGCALAGLFVNDSRIVDVEARKRWAENGFVGVRVSVVLPL